RLPLSPWCMRALRAVYVTPAVRPLRLSAWAIPRAPRLAPHPPPVPYSARSSLAKSRWASSSGGSAGAPARGWRSTRRIRAPPPTPPPPPPPRRAALVLLASPCELACLQRDRPPPPRRVGQQSVGVPRYTSRP